MGMYTLDAAWVDSIVFTLEEWSHTAISKLFLFEE